MSTTTKISIRTNLYLWLLTGRTDDFVNASLNNSIRYSVKDTPEEVRYARKFLGLDDTRTDFNILAILAAAKMSKAMLRDMPTDNDSVFVPGLLQLPGASCSATLLSPNDHSWPSIDGGRAGADGFTSIVFRHVGAGAVSIITDTGKVYPGQFSTVAEDGGTIRVHIPQAADYGIRADFRVSSWATDDEISVGMAPTRFPYRAVEQQLRRNRTMMRLMNAEGTLAVFESSAANPALQVGMAGLAVIRRMLKWINEEQAGFSVTITAESDGLSAPSRRYTIDLTSVDGLTDAPVTNEQPVGFNV